MTPRFDPELTLKLIEATCPDLLLMVPVTMQALLRNALWEQTDLSSLRLMVTGSSIVPKNLIEGFHQRNIPVGQVFGSTETAPIAAVLRKEDAFSKVGSTGKPALHCEVKIVDDSGCELPPGKTGELWVKGANVMQEYWGDPEATAEAKTPDGWVHTGDAGYFDKEGYLRIIDRAADVGKLNNGSIYAPKFLENKLKFFPQIKEAVTFGDQKDYVTAFINIDLEAISNWAEKNDVTYASYHELAANDQVSTLIQDCVSSVNQELANEDQFKASQIQRFVVLHKELDADDGELTRTRKVRRKYVADKYSTLVDALYSDKDNVHIETEVTFEDGRKGSIEADVRICDMVSAGASV